MRSQSYVDFVGDSEGDEVEQTALGTWGDDLHAAPATVAAHYTQICEHFGAEWQEGVRGAVLEIGCGSGTDSLALARKEEVRHLYSFDIGRNVAGLGRLPLEGKVSFFRANALCIPIRSGVIDAVYSFGVFHHTSDPARCISEVFRVLAGHGCLFLYVYSAHEHNPLKRLGILAERLLVDLMKNLPKPWRARCCVLLSPLMWALFSLPARILRMVGLRKAARRLPMHWGTTPLSLVPDLKDRLLAPVNHRYSRTMLTEALVAAGFENVRVIRTSSGLYGFCAKPSSA